MPYMQSGSYPGLLKGLLNSTTGAGVWGQIPGIEYLYSMDISFKHQYYNCI